MTFDQFFGCSKIFCLSFSTMWFHEFFNFTRKKMLNKNLSNHHEGGNGFDFYSAYCSVILKFLSKEARIFNFASLLMATLENGFSTWGNSRVQLFLSTSWCISLYHEWPKATSDGEMHQRVLRKSWTRELPHVEKTFSNVAINKLVKSFKNMVFWLETSVLRYNMQSRNQNHFLPHGKKAIILWCDDVHKNGYIAKVRPKIQNWMPTFG